MAHLVWFIAVVFAFGLSAQAAVIPDEDWGYVNVRQSAHMFWWLYGMQDETKRDQAPVVVWLQGGPGASSTGFGNFEEIGPLDVNLQPRPINWVQSANILFIDNPVGTGYSYVDDQSAYCTSDDQIGVDLVAFLKELIANHYPSFAKLPFWIFCESYGGKMATAWGVNIVKAIQKGELDINFKGVALGDSWISPMSFVGTWGDYLLTTSEIDSNGWASINASAMRVQAAIANGQWDAATSAWGDTENVVDSVSAGVNFYNILDRSSSDNGRKSSRRVDHRHLSTFFGDDLDTLMNGPIKQKLGIPANVTWGGQSNNVFESLSVAFMQPIIDGVDFLLSQGVQVVIYSGNLDLICCTTGTNQWMDQLKWSQYQKFKQSARQPMSLSNIVVSFTKRYQNLQLWNILAAGHMVPADQPGPAQQMLNQIINSNN